MEREASSEACCAPPRKARPGEPAPGRPIRGPGTYNVEQVGVPAGTFLMGDGSGHGNPGDGEIPVHEVSVDGFDIDATTVTNEDWAKFAQVTGYRSEAELFGFSAVFHLAIETERENLMNPVPGAPWWIGVRGADWAHPGGPGSDLTGRGDHPVVHVSWNDAQAYCRWAARRLPTEAEWEYAARGGIESAVYPWGDGDVLDERGEWRCNIWQGLFPRQNTVADGWLTTAPVRSYSPNGIGLWQMVGNVWEWCSDWFSPEYYSVSPKDNPVGPTSGHQRVLRGGSYLCHNSYCNRYRNSARSSNTPDSSTGNTGFRTVALNGH